MSIKTTINGIFLKKEVTHNNQTYYHFILPEIYHGNYDKISHTTNTLTNFDKKIMEENEKKIDKLDLYAKVTNICNYRPIYKDNIISVPTIKFSHFKAKSSANINCIVGLEYQLLTYLNSYSFIDKENPDSQINGWYIRIVSMKEVTKLI